MSARRKMAVAAGLALLVSALWGFAAAAESFRGAADTPTVTNQFLRVLLLKDYNTRVVVLGTALLGVAAGVIGSFTLLRKRALMGDALSHAMLPGIGLAFMYSVAAGGSGKSLPVLLAGATVSGLVGLGVILWLRNFTRLKEDAALGVVLSVFFGGGVAILGVAQRLGQGHAAGLESFIYGKTAAMLASDAMLIGGAALAVILVCSLLFKEFRLLCFDAEYASSLGWRTAPLDILMMGMAVVVIVIGLQAVGLILVIAMLIIPAASARFWTEQLGVMTWLSAAFGAAAGTMGSAGSALFPRLPSGAMIVLAGICLFGLSMAFGTKRGLLIRWANQHRVHRKVRRQHLLRAAFELRETISGTGVPMAALLNARSWSSGELRRAIRQAARDGLVCVNSSGAVVLTRTGEVEAKRVVRNHRLWELFLITHADIAPSHVDRDADALEHVLPPEMVCELEEVLLRQTDLAAVPASPHAMPPQAA